MGMDVYGRRPKNKDGEYFRANVWSWRPIHMICLHAIDKNGLGFNTDYWGSNDGKGLTGQRQCNQLADAVEKIVQDIENNTMDSEMSEFFTIRDHEEYGRGVEMNTGNDRMLVDDQGRFVTADEAKKNNVKTHSPYSTNVEHLKEWVKFLRNCGGFKIC